MKPCSRQIARLTAASASLKVGCGLGYHAADAMSRRWRAGSRVASKVTIENKASRQGVVRDGLVAPLPLRLDAEMSASLLEGDLDLPAPHEPGNNLRRLPREVSAEQDLRSEAVLGIVDRRAIWLWRDLLQLGR